MMHLGGRQQRIEQKIGTLIHGLPLRAHLPQRGTAAHTCRHPAGLPAQNLQQVFSRPAVLFRLLVGEQGTRRLPDILRHMDKVDDDDQRETSPGTVVLSDRIVIEITSSAGESFLDRMIALVEGAIRQRSPNEIALTLVLSAFTLIFLIVVIPLLPMARNAELYMQSYLGIQEPVKSLGTDVPTLIALLVCLIPTTIGALLAAIGIAGMDRALQANIIAKSGKAVELAGDIDVVLLDKTGTITIGNRNATTFLPVGKYSASDVGRLAALASAADATPEGKSIVQLFEKDSSAPIDVPPEAKFIAFTAQTRMSGIDLPDGQKIRKGAPDAIVKFIGGNGGSVPPELSSLVNSVASQGATPLAVADGPNIVGLVVLEDILSRTCRSASNDCEKWGFGP